MNNFVFTVLLLPTLLFGSICYSAAENPDIKFTQEKLVSGSRVQLYGLINRSDLNGEYGIVKNIDAASGMASVRLLKGQSDVRAKLKNIKLINLEHALANYNGDNSKKLSVAMPMSDPRAGSLVKIHGLKKDPSYNGIIGVYKMLDPATKRLLVLVTHKSEYKEISLKKQNVTFLKESSTNFPQHREPDWNNTYLIHRTRVLKNSTIVPGQSLTIKLEKLDEKTNFYDDPIAQAEMPLFCVTAGDASEQSMRFYDVNRMLPPVRLTSHWTIAEPVREAHVGDEIYSWAKESIFIAEPASQLKDQIYGGYHDDVLVIGEHKLSALSRVYIPQDLVDTFNKENPNFAGSLIPYQPGKTDIITTVRNLTPNLVRVNDDMGKLCPQDLIKLTKLLVRGITSEGLSDPNHKNIGQHFWTKTIELWKTISEMEKMLKGGSSEEEIRKRFCGRESVLTRMLFFSNHNCNFGCFSFQGHFCLGRELFHGWWKDLTYFGYHSSGFLEEIERNVNEVFQKEILYFVRAQILLLSENSRAIKYLFKNIFDENKLKVTKPIKELEAKRKGISHLIHSLTLLESKVDSFSLNEHAKQSIRNYIATLWSFLSEKKEQLSRKLI